MSTLTPDFDDFLPRWIAAQRWYRGKSSNTAAPALRTLASVRWEDPFGEVGMEVHILVDESGPAPVVYQVPLTYRAEPVDFLADALVATAAHSELGTRYIYDATHDPVFAQTLLQHMYAERDVPSARAHRIVAGGQAPALASSRVLRGEQSNTSIIVQAHGQTRPVIIKVFRVLHAGENPDVTITTAIARAGNRMVPGPIGYVEGRWPGSDGTEVRGHLAFAAEFVPDTQDAWRTALDAARAQDDFTRQARTLGAATASVHGALRDAFDTPAVDADSRHTLVSQMRDRATTAFEEVPELARYSEQVGAVYDELEHLELPALQRVHGDFHLGQVLDAPGRGWVLLDFEGEPLRALEDRNASDLAFRDVAGMLRSFDYAAATVDQEGGGTRDAWALAAREAFLEGYTTQSGQDLDAADSRRILNALELDKALYEVVYEARNRPSWLPIPVSAVQRLLGQDSRGQHAPLENLFAADEGEPGRHRADEPEPQVSGLRDLDPAVHGPSSSDPEGGETYAGHETRLDAAATDVVAADARADAVVPSSASAASTLANVSTPPETSEDMPDLSPTSYPRASGGYPHAPVQAPPEMLAALEDGQDTFAPTPASERPASGGIPHAPIAPPAEMTAARELLPEPVEGIPEEDFPIVDSPAADTSVADTSVRRYPPASGLAPRTETGDTMHSLQGRDRAWAEAIGSPDIVLGAAPSPGDALARRVPLAAPTTPAPPHTRPLDLEEATDVVYGLHRNPHDILGAHEHQGHTTIRTLQPDADAVTILLPAGGSIPMRPETGGIWVAVVEQANLPTYRLQIDELGRRRIVDEAYRHAPTLSEKDLQLLAQGRHEELWRVLGSHVRTVHDDMGPVAGTYFAVWAPHALAVHVIGDFNDWDGAQHALRVHEGAGVWEIFIPGVGAGAHYKYDITGPDGTRRAKADPMARASEVPPFNNSVVTHSTHEWSQGDAAWMARRSQTDPHHGPMSIYEVHLGSWRPGLSYEQLADELVDYVAQLGFTHVELMPVMQHPYGPSWGYHVTGYYAADSRFGHEDGLRYLIDRLHQINVGVILDWVPGHFATDPWALARFDGTPCYEHPDPRKGWHPEWGSYIFDFGRPQVRNFLVANASYWLEEFHADGLRVDGVASMLYLDYSRDAGQWVPNRFGGRENLEAVEVLQETNATAYRRNPGVMMIAEESTSWPGVTSGVEEGGLGFGFKWNMGWMHDTLSYLALDPYARARQHHSITFALVYAYSEKFILPISHDEVVHGKGSLVRKMAGDAWQKFATTRAFFAYQWSHPGKQLIFMGSEFAQSREWADGGSLQWDQAAEPMHAGVARLVTDLNRLYQELPSLWEIDHHEDGFTWLSANSAGRNTYSYLRWGNEGEDGLRAVVAVLVNFSGVTQSQVHVGLPYGGRWREVLNTDAEVYGGAGVGNMGQVEAYDHPHERQPFSALVTVPAMGAVWLVPDPVDPQIEEPAEHDQQEDAPSSDSEEIPPGRQLSAVTSFAAVQEGAVTNDAVPTGVADTTPVGALDLDQADTADGDFGARAEPGAAEEESEEETREAQD
ncbi:MAG: 1,4-alpha-glucan branching protein GlgB [Ornithinimicrobium sp.]|uniref:1,4-alpha-glucan branching protein GlgB n=1 Tax=Ornithinimicrobium sp. TaxID=1977084 RepID=UPI0026DFEFAE|nr:1,4-alpha-glucan branching protein GlgB [Ornithinimicrobium sp.]MDO5740239.1 1,4-alpha-glucan branching protein GlgB [Ornithinimicrobium sp.]